MVYFTDLVDKVSGIVWNSILLYLLVGTGLLYTIRTRFVQVRKFPEGLKRMFGSFKLNGEQAGKDGMSSFQALTTAIAAQVGTGNIAGCATALYSGGPGAIFWMWISAFFGMATNYGEAVLAQKYKQVNSQGEVTGGPVYYIKACFKGKFGKALAVFFSISIVIALGFSGNMVQANSIGQAFYTAFGFDPLLVGVLIAALAAFTFIGGVKRVAFLTEKLVPVMAGLYIVGCIIVLFINHSALIPALKSIVIGAFDPHALFGGAAGIGVREAMRYGVARGLFSNEAGMGSTPHAHAIAKVDQPQDQGVMALMAVFIDTFVVLNLTALVILTSGKLIPGAEGIPQGIAMAQAAFGQAFGTLGVTFIAICLLFFAFSTIISWYFFGEVNVKALFGEGAVKGYMAIVILCLVLGSFLKVQLVWNLSDLFNALMVFPNLIALLFSSSLVAKAARGEDILK